MKKIQDKTEMQVQTISGLVQSTRGVTFYKAKLLYSAIVRPALIYVSPVWAITGAKDKIPEMIVKPPRSIQCKCLQKVIGASKSISTKVSEHKTLILPIEIYLKYRRV